MSILPLTNFTLEEITNTSPDGFEAVEIVKKVIDNQPRRLGLVPSGKKYEIFGTQANARQKYFVKLLIGDPVIEIGNLKKRYRATFVLHGVNHQCTPKIVEPRTLNFNNEAWEVYLESDNN